MEVKDLVLICAGILIGIIIKYILEMKKQGIGVVQIDHNSGLCRFKITNENLTDLKIKKIMLTVEHDAVIDEDLTE